MPTFRFAKDRGASDLGWLKSHHTFSFSSYQDPNFMGHGVLRVINDDVVEAGAGFKTHPHEDMEIISYVLDGALEHKDSMGNGSVIPEGDVQRMSAGTGVTHSEFNHSKDSPVHFLQIWFLPEQNGLAPGYEQKHFSREDKLGKLKLVASRKGREGSVSLNQDVDMYAGVFDAMDEPVTHALASDRQAWVHIARGQAMVNGQAMSAGDGAAFEVGEDVILSGAESLEVLVFDMKSA